MRTAYEKHEEGQNRSRKNSHEIAYEKLSSTKHGFHDTFLKMQNMNLILRKVIKPRLSRPIKYYVIENVEVTY